MSERILCEDRIRAVAEKPDISEPFRHSLLRILEQIESVRSCGGVPICILDEDGCAWVMDATEQMGT